MVSLIERADALAATWHAGQLRKDERTPYVEHPRRVAEMVRSRLGSTPVGIATALCHDVLEDTAVPSSELLALHPDVLLGVWWLTSPDKDGSRISALPRAERKRFQREKIAGAPEWCVEIKLADRLDNLRDWPSGMAGMWPTYREETRALLERARESYPRIARHRWYVEIMDMLKPPGGAEEGR